MQKLSEAQKKVVKPRITLNYLKDWLTNKMVELELPFVCVESYRTRYRAQDYENGAYALGFRMAHVEQPEIYEFTVYSFYSIATLKQHIDIGYQMFLHIKRNAGLQEAEIELRKN